LAGLAGSVVAQDYPTKPIKVLIAFPPGGPTDAIGRVIFQELGRRIGQQLIIDNRPGGGGNIATEVVAQAEPDGYTLLYASSSIAISPSLYNRANLDPSKVLTTLGCTVSVPQLLLVAPGVAANSVGDLVRMLKAEPGKFFQGSSGNGALDHMVGAIFAKELDVKFVHVSYKGNGPALTDLIAGRVQFMFAGAFNSALPFIREKRVKALAISSQKRAGILPDVPSLSETVMKGFDASTWQVLVAPPGTPPAVVRFMNEHINATMAVPAIKDNMFQQGAEIIAGTPAHCAEFIKSEYARWGDVIRKYNIRAD